MTPRIEGEALAMRRAYDEVQIDPRSITLVEGHGTATIAGDSTEIDALHEVFGKAGDSVALGSVKSMIGHAMPAAGMAGLIKTALAIYHRLLPPTLNVEKVHPKLEGSRFSVNTAWRPWVSRPERPRRAGVNAFGFGGINAHAVLEEAADTTPWQSQTPHSCELLLVSAGSRSELLDRVLACGQRAVTLREKDLADICFTESLHFSRDHELRLAIIVKSTADLASKIERIPALLNENKGPFWKDADGIYYGSQRYPGKLGVLFPGIGFPGLAGGFTERLAELYLHFPEVREELDLVDSMTREGQDTEPLSYKLFPPPLLNRADAARIERELVWSEDSPIGMSMANTAGWRLLRSFGVQPDAIVGFSLGEISALFASEIIDPQRFNLDTMRQVQDLMKTLAQPDEANEALWAMLSTSAEQAEAVMRGIPGTLSVTIDVSPTQVFIGGDAAAVRETLRQLEQMGIWGQALPNLPFLAPFLRVHTAMAGPMEARFRAVLQTLPIGVGRFKVYSGSLATPYPAKPAEIRDLILASVTNPVRIRDTVKRFYDEGVRVFIQLGSGGKMLSNIQNTLEGLDHVALSTDLQHRGGLEQVLHLMGHLATLAVPFEVAALYNHRKCCNLDEPAAPARSSTRRLSLKPPRLHLTGEDAAWIRSQYAAIEPAPAPAQSAVVSNRGPAVPARAAAAAAGSLGGVAGQTVSMMQRFLEVQKAWEDTERELMGRFLDTQHAGARALFSNTPPPAPVSLDEGRLRRPFIGQIHHFVPGQEIESTLVLDLSHHVFLTEHALLNVPEALKPMEERLATLPLTFEIETLSQIAEALFPALHVIACHSLEAKKWICLESSRTLTVAIRGKRVGDAEVEVELQPEGHTKPAFRGRATLAVAPPAPPAPLDQTYDRVCPHTAEQFYQTGPMFHGPMFCLIRSFHGMSDQDIGAELVAGDPAWCLSEPPQPWVFEPLLLDALQQIVGYRAWLDGWFTMPTGMKRISRFGPPPAPGSRIRASVRYRKLDGRRIEADYEAYDENGRLWIRVDSLQAWRVLCPKTLLEANHKPREGYLGTPWLTGVNHFTACRVGVNNFGDINPDWLARLYLRATEWETYRQRPALDWLLGRIAAKDAVRAWLRDRQGILLHPLEVEIKNEADGAPRFVVPAMPSLALSIAHIEDEAVAIVSESAGIGVDLAAVKARGREFADFAFSGEELALFPPASRDAWIHRGWCAKEAAVKAFRLGLAQLPDFHIHEIDESTGAVVMIWRSQQKRVSAATFIEANRAFAVVEADVAVRQTAQYQASGV
jgi:malonyl CoA-acyl carrier protein transacylase/phosphopantetheinyl transferase